MQTHLFTGHPIPYDGRQLSPHWLYRQFDLLGNAIAAFTGPCRVDLSEMVDLVDVKAAAPIYSPLMLHCIAEFFQTDLELAVYRQRLLIVTAKELLEEMTGQQVQRRGDDLYLPRRDGTPGKLSVSIATVSPTSTLIHTGFNIETEGTPVPTIGLTELGVDIPAFAAELLHRYAAEVQDIWLARCKVRAV
ncbi:MAG: DUF366 family protein [Anaerolineae bacterium]|nr:DUF366 family protein [Anaerolineales bacterium]MCQ3977998.1 DUF366 domain-containing protein [Anaerolineae bacterium]